MKWGPWISAFPFDSTCISIFTAHAIYWLSRAPHIPHVIANGGMALFLAPITLATLLGLFMPEQRKYVATRLCFLTLVALPVWL